MNRTALNYIVLQGLHKVPLSTTLSLSLRKILPSTTHYFLLQSLHRILPSTTLYYKACTKHPPSSTLYYKACTGYFPVLLCKARTKYFPVLCTTKFARYFPVLLCTAKFAHGTVLPSTTFTCQTLKGRQQCGLLATTSATAEQTATPITAPDAPYAVINLFYALFCSFATTSPA